MSRFFDFIIDHPVLGGAVVILMLSSISYFMATIGEPRAVWIWRDIFGAL